ncbi:MAG: isoleucine--tRNA ligase [Deltaproteobacteria bacterium]|jgi:isoleucyl-tRNA synthetase|nr:isoleucine--tRNA ligase [Deltaproteobacteria bacterium]
MDYKDTLNLPKTSFPMKARLPETEPKLLALWEGIDLYHAIQAKGEGRPAWTLHDGPPYANGRIHLGTALNKILKDIVVKARTMEGYRSPYVPGWDCHGLPIEHQVDKTLGAKRRELPTSKVRELCRKYAEKFVGIQREEFKRLGVLGEWEDPYLTMSPRYEAVTAREFGKIALEGGLSRSVKPVLWCGSCRTALAEAEVEYQEDTSASIFVAFRLKDGAEALGLAGREVSFVIWTTTPWTIPSNMAVAYSPRFSYGAYAKDGKAYVMARELAPRLLGKLGLEGAEDLGELDSRAFDGLSCVHPIYERDSRLVPALYVTLEQGTGLVHTAPGHGREDFETGIAFGLPVFSPLDDDARFTEEVPELQGRKVMDTNGDVIEMLKGRGALMAEERLTHQYPHCWRCKEPVVFRATPQWFVSMEHGGLRTRALEAIDTVSWIPARGRERIRGMIESRPDWCVSRQRTWGVPITVFFCDSCGEWLYTPEIHERVFALFAERGADAWYDTDAADILPPGQACPHCGGKAFTKETDILDVWFDSGSSFAAVMEDRQSLPDTADMYLEGSDQHRGWFHSSLLISVSNREGSAPYREVLTHGYVVDGQGKKMSKSIGNTVEPAEIIKKYGADVLRLWVASENYQDDIRVSDQILDMLVKAYFSFRNTCRFMLGNLFDFDPRKDAVPFGDIADPLDRHALRELSLLVRQVRKGYASYAFHDVYHRVNNFMGSLSSFYLDVLKDRLYTFSASDPARRASQTVMREILVSVTALMAPVLSFTAEEIWRSLNGLPPAGSPGTPGGTGRGASPAGGAASPASSDSAAQAPSPAAVPESVFLTDFPSPVTAWEEDPVALETERLLAVRAVALKALEDARKTKLIGSSLDAEVEILASGPVLELLKKHESRLPELFIVSRVVLGEASSPPADAPADGWAEARVSMSPDPKCPRCWNRHPEVPADGSGVCPKCRRALG